MYIYEDVDKVRCCASVSVLCRWAVQRLSCQAVQQFRHITFLASSVCQSSWKLFLMMSIPSHSWVSVMMRGGANRILSPWVGLARRLFSASCRQKSQALWPAELHKKELLVPSSTSLPYKAGQGSISDITFYTHIVCTSNVVLRTVDFRLLIPSQKTKIQLTNEMQAIPKCHWVRQFLLFSVFSRCDKQPEIDCTSQE